MVVLVGGLRRPAVATDTLGAGHLFDRAVAKVDRFLAGPCPIVDADGPGDRSAGDTPTPTDTPVPTPSRPGGTSPADPRPDPDAEPTPASRSTSTSSPTRPVFAHELKDTWCASAGVQMVLAILGHGDTSDAFQRELQGRVREWESYKDSHNGDWGPSAMALALDAYGAKGYEVRAYKTRQGALRDAAKAIEKTESPVILLAWRGAHTWVMTGFRADADPALFPDAKINGTYILDPWYPDVSSIWGPSDPPGTFQNEAEMIRNYLEWKRPEGTYPDRDGLFIAVVPTVVVKPVELTPIRRTRGRRGTTAEQDVLGDHPGGVAERDGEDARAPAPAASSRRRRPPARRTRRGPGGACRASRTARARAGRPARRTGPTARTPRRRPTSARRPPGRTSPPPSSTSTSGPAQDEQGDRGQRRQDRDRRPGSGRGSRGSRRPSSSANAADRTGKTASENETPIRLTGRTW